MISSLKYKWLPAPGFVRAKIYGQSFYQKDFKRQSQEITRDHKTTKLNNQIYIMKYKIHVE